ncbi:MAG: heat shock protein 90 [Chaenotheca gracillima]|nr:MAG: heat shock protein 90 [Chaenotheca gracillima]
MATEQPQLPVNGDYAHGGVHYTNAAEHHLSSQSQANLTAGSGPAPGSFGSQNANVPSNAGTAGSNQTHAEVPKDEVGWYFVEQYYTNLSRSPDKLHLFYSKRSQFVSGLEAEKVQVSVGRHAISERIKELEFQDCKVRVSNVDSQSSFDNIVIQVIGEMSNKSAPHRKFVQTFVLAEQPNGYFVLNDIFRYIDDEEEEGEDEPAAAAAAEAYQETPAPAEPQQLTSSADQAQQQHDVAKVDADLEQKVSKEETAAPAALPVETSAAAPQTNGSAVTDTVNAEDTPAAAVSVKDTSSAPAPGDAELAAKSEAQQPEKPKDPAPSPAAPATSTPSAAPAPAPAKPAVPKTWANLVAASKTNATGPSASASVASTSPAPTQGKQPPPPAAQSTPTDAPAGQTQGSNAGWQTAGTEHAKRQGRPQSISTGGDKEVISAYVKSVTEKVRPENLKAALQKFGDLAHFDVNRAKNCAFVDFATLAGYQAAVAANPHQVDGESIAVEERRPRAGNYGGSGYGAGRGGPGRGRGGPENRPGSQGRGGFQKDGGRGGYGSGRGRGGASTPRGGRGGPQVA